MRRRVGWLLMILGSGVLILAGTAAILVARAQSGDQQPANVGNAALGDPHTATSQEIAFFAQRVERDPVDFVSYTHLGEAYLQQARETGDIGAYQRAEAAFQQALRIQPDDLMARTGQATALYAMHDFPAALQIAQQVYAYDSSATQALAIVADANLALGDYKAAYAAHGKLAEAASGPAVLSRLSYLDELRGDRDAAIRVMSDAEEAAAKAKRSPEAIAFYRLQLGNLYFGSGRYDKAAQWYQAALDVFPDYYQALAGLGNVEAARGHYDKAIAYYRQSVAAVPQPAVLAALGDTYARIGDASLAQQQYETVEFIGLLAAINQVVYNRELALFYADHGIKTGIAVDQALSELVVRKDIYAYDAAAWALYADGRAREAAPYIVEALKLGTKDARMLFHAGMIASAIGQDREAAEYLQQALALNPHFSVLQETQARQALARIEAGSGSLAQTKE